MIPYASNCQPISLEGTKSSYGIGIDITSFAATATDILQIIGVAGKTIKICRLSFSAVSTAGGVIDAYVIKRTTPNTGGTATTLTPALYDSTDPAPGATVLNYTANPSGLGTGIILKVAGWCLPPAASGYPMHPLQFIDGTYGGKNITLNGPNESLCVNLNGAVIQSGLTIWIDIKWTE